MAKDIQTGARVFTPIPETGESVLAAQNIEELRSAYECKLKENAVPTLQLKDPGAFYEREMQRDSYKKAQ